MIDLLTTLAATCSKPSFFSFPTWYQYLPVEEDSQAGICEVQFSLMENGQFHYDDILLVSLGIIDILVRLAALVAVAFVIYGGFRYMTSQGSPDGTKAAMHTIVQAAIGLIVTLLAATIVGFIGRSIG